MKLLHLWNTKFSLPTKRKILWGVLILVMAGIFFMSSLPNEVSSGIFSMESVLRKIAHLFEYGVLFSVLVALYRTYGVNFSNSLFYALVLSVLYSLSDELHQSFVATRTGTYRDVVIDTTGMLIASWLIIIFHTDKRLDVLK